MLDEFVLTLLQLYNVRNGYSCTRTVLSLKGKNIWFGKQFHSRHNASCSRWLI